MRQVQDIIITIGQGLVIQDGINLQRIPIMDEKCLMMLRNQCFTKMCNYSIIFIYSYISRGYDAKDSYM